MEWPNLWNVLINKTIRFFTRMTSFDSSATPCNPIRSVYQMTWNNIKTQSEADALMKHFGGFHDGCIREAHLWTDHWVSEDLSMSVSFNQDNNIRFLIQRQFKNPSSIELLFKEVIRFNLHPAPENYDSIILRAVLIVDSDKIFWSPDDVCLPDSDNRDDYTWISAKQMSWRDVDLMGKKLNYGPDKT